MTKFEPSHRTHWRERMHEVIFEADTFGGRVFDVGLFIAIAISVLVVMLESVESIDKDYHAALRVTDLVLTGLFTIEYILRLLCVARTWRYARSFFGIVDLLAVLPGITSLFFAGTQSLLVIRALRMLRIFRVLKMGHYVGEAEHLMKALGASRRKIIIFMGAVSTLTVIMGALMYLIEGSESGFTSIPRGVYWAIVTMTTVGYGDIAPQSVLGQFVAAVLMIAGYGIIAVPTGIVSVELAAAAQVSNKACKSCMAERHDPDAQFCKYCGGGL